MRNTPLLILFGLFFSFAVNADEPIANIGELNYDFAEAHRAALGLPRLYSLLVSHRGELVFEEYYNGTDLRRPANMKSASKSVISALVGIAIEKVTLSLLMIPLSNIFQIISPTRSTLTSSSLL